MSSHVISSHLISFSSIVSHFTSLLLSIHLYCLFSFSIPSPYFLSMYHLLCLMFSLCSGDLVARGWSSIVVAAISLTNIDSLFHRIVCNVSLVVRSGMWWLAPKARSYRLNKVSFRNNDCPQGQTKEMPSFAQHIDEMPSERSFYFIDSVVDFTLVAISILALLPLILRSEEQVITQQTDDIHPLRPFANNWQEEEEAESVRDRVWKVLPNVVAIGVLWIYLQSLLSLFGSLDHRHAAHSSYQTASNNAHQSLWRIVQCFASLLLFLYVNVVYHSKDDGDYFRLNWSDPHILSSCLWSESNQQIEAELCIIIITTTAFPFYSESPTRRYNTSQQQQTRVVNPLITSVPFPIDPIPSWSSNRRVVQSRSQHIPLPSSTTSSPLRVYLRSTKSPPFLYNDNYKTHRIREWRGLYMKEWW